LRAGEQLREAREEVRLLRSQMQVMKDVGLGVWGLGFRVRL
jgi:hypothetical protein